MKQLLHLRKMAVALMLIAFSLPAFSQPFVKVLLPDEANIYWELGTEKLISWNSNFTKPVKIELINEEIAFGDPGYLTEIAASVTGSTYTWDIDPLLYPAGSKYLIRVSSTVNNNFTDVSDNWFSLVNSLPGSYLKVEQPNESGITWLKGTQHLISWDCNVPGTFKIRLLDYTGGTPPVSTVIANGVEGSTYVWTIPGTIANGSKYRIRVISETDADIKDRSDNDFTISDVPDGAEITVLQPSENNISWLRGGEYLLSWIDNVPDPVNIELYSSTPFTIASDDADNYGGSWSHGDNEGNGFEDWVFTVNGTGEAFIGDPAAGNIVGMDTESFGLIAKSDPANNANTISAYRAFSDPLEVGSTFSFDWGLYGRSGYKDFVLYSGGNAGDELVRIWLADGSHSIFIENDGITSTMFTNLGSFFMTFSIEYVDDENIRLIASGRDGIESYDQILPVTGAPDAFRFYAEGQLDDANYLLRANYFNNLKIKRHTLDIANGVVGSTYLWTIPSNVPYGSTYKLYVWDATETVKGESEYFFSIVGSLPGSFITVEQPNESGIEWIRGSSYLISWNDNVPGPLNIYLMEGATQHTLATGVEGSTWVWDIPQLTYPTGSNYKIKVGNSSLSDDSDNTFTLSDYPAGGNIEVLQPSVSGIVWLRGSAYLISWLPDFLSGPVDVELWKGGVHLADLVTNYEGSTWTWDIPQITYPEATDYTIRVYANNGTVYGESANAFALADTPGGTIEVLQPNGGEILYRGTGYLIAWIDDVPEPMRIILHNDATSTTEVLANNVVGSTWVWNIPSGQALGTQYRIRIRSVYSNTIRDFSDGQFTITDLPMAFTVYPNPVRDQFTVKFDEMANESFTVQLKDKYNMVVFEQQVDASQMKELRLTTTGISNGVYFLTITSQTSRNTQKILIQK